MKDKPSNSVPMLLVVILVILACVAGYMISDRVSNKQYETLQTKHDEIKGYYLDCLSRLDQAEDDQFRDILTECLEP